MGTPVPPSPLLLSQPFSIIPDYHIASHSPVPSHEEHIGPFVPFQPLASKKIKLSEDTHSEQTHRSPFSSFPPGPQPHPNPPSGKEIFFKTRLCPSFRIGTCRYGSYCTFAHGEEEIREPPPNWQEVVWQEEQQRNSKSKICRKFYNGEGCRYGNRCTFLHEGPERNRENLASNVSPISITSDGSKGGSDQVNSTSNSGSGNDSNGSSQRPSVWKTRLCHKWETTGLCPFGERCNFAHGQAELQKLSWRTESSNGKAANGAAAKLVPHTTTLDILPGEFVVQSSKQQELQVKRCLLHSKGLAKISRIYGDWIEDFPPGGAGN